MTDSDQLKSDQAGTDPAIGEQGGQGPAKKRGLKALAFLTVLFSILIIIILVLMWLTPSAHFFPLFKVKADPLDKLDGWFMIRPEAGQQTELFTLAVAKEADAVYLSSTVGLSPATQANRPALPRPSGTPAKAATQEPADQGSALLMVGCVEGQVMPPTFAFSQLVAAQTNQALPHPPKPCALRYSIDDYEMSNASCIFDGIVASLVQPPGPRDHLLDAGEVLLNSAEQGRSLTVQLSVDAGQALTAFFDVSQLALARMRLQRECRQY